jgi:2-polyprenyl-6-methoxyphenol hydroxylase-like FAD-dependent oxidoreductase
MRILISGASIAGPVLAYWLTRAGFKATVVERAPTLRKTGGHAVDLLGPSMDISAKMGVLARIEELATGTDTLTIYRKGGRRQARIDLTKIVAAASDRHVEIMRDDLSEIYYDAGRDHVEYLFGESIAAISPDGEVTFEQAASRRFDVVVGADGLRSNVRRLIFGDEAELTRFIGGYLAVLSAPKALSVDGEMVMHAAAGRIAGIYSADHLDDARALFMFRAKEVLRYHYRDVLRQKELLRDAFTGMAPQVDSWLAELDRTPSFYFDSITQLQLDTWSSGRVTLVGDAGYCPGPAVGGSTSLAVLGAYVLAAELAEANGDYVQAFSAYEREMKGPVLRSRAFAHGAAKAVIPGSAASVWAVTRGAQVVSLLPSALTRTVARLNTKGVRMHDSMRVKDYSQVWQHNLHDTRGTIVDETDRCRDME